MCLDIHHKLFYFCNIIILQLKEALEQICHAELFKCTLSIWTFQPCKTWDSKLSGKGKMKRKEDGHHESGDQRLEDPPADTLTGRAHKPCQVNRPGSCCRRLAYLMCLWTQQVWAVGTSWLGCPSPGWYVLQQGYRKRDKMQSWVFEHKKYVYFWLSVSTNIVYNTRLWWNMNLCFDFETQLLWFLDQDHVTACSFLCIMYFDHIPLICWCLCSVLSTPFSLSCLKDEREKKERIFLLLNHQGSPSWWNTL